MGEPPPHCTALYGRFFPPKAEPLYRPGEIIRDTPELSFNRNPLTLLELTASTCHFCTASMPFYRRLNSAARKAGTRVVGVAPEDPEINRANFERNEVPIDDIVPLAKAGIRLRATPALILVNSNGLVVNSWLGRLRKQEEDKVLSAVGLH